MSKGAQHNTSNGQRTRKDVRHHDVDLAASGRRRCPHHENGIAVVP